MECFKAELEEQAEPLGPAGNWGHAFHDPNRAASVGERRPSRVPQLRQGNGRMRNKNHAMRNDQP